jgi:uncharacterized protein YjbI with pentapeptide repeats
MTTKSDSAAHKEAAHKTAPIQPNMLSINGDGTSSTFSSLKVGHSVFAGSSFFNTIHHRSSFEGSEFSACELDGAMFENCSFKGVELRNCDVEGLVINGFRVGELLKLLIAR